MVSLEERRHRRAHGWSGNDGCDADYISSDWAGETRTKDDAENVNFLPG